MPASAPILVTVNTDFSSDQWRKVVAVFDKFPDGNLLLAQVQKELKGVRLADFKAALGPEVDVTVLSLESAAGTVVLNQPKDRAKLKTLLAESTQPPVTEDVGSWTAFADKRADLDRFDRARKDGTLDGSSTFRDAMKEAAGDAEATVYVNGKAVQDRLQGVVATSRVKQSSSQLGNLDWIVASASAKSDGISITGDAHGSLKNPPSSYKPALPDELPSGALAFVSFAHLDKPLEQLYKTVESASPTFKTQLNQVEGVLGLSVEGDVLPVFSGEGALAVYPSTQTAKGLSIPDVAFVEKVSDEGKVRNLIGRLSSLAALSGGTVKATKQTVAGVAAEKFEYEGITVFATVFDGKLVVTNAESVVSRMHSGSGAKLSDDPVYKQAAGAAGLPSDVLGFAYVNLRSGLPVVFRLVEETGSTVPKVARDNTAPLRSVLVYSTADGHDYRFGGFVTIK